MSLRNYNRRLIKTLLLAQRVKVGVQKVQLHSLSPGAPTILILTLPACNPVRIHSQFIRINDFGHSHVSSRTFG